MPSWHLRPFSSWEVFKFFYLFSPVMMIMEQFKKEKKTPENGN